MPKITNLSSFLIVAFIAAPAYSQSDTEIWELNCNDEACAARLELKETGSERLAATFMLSVRKDEPAPFIGVAVPLGSAMEPGVRLVVAEGSIDIPFQVCYPDGCRAMRAINPNEEVILKETPEVDLRFFPFGSETPVSMTIPLEGLTETIAAARTELGN